LYLRFYSFAGNLDFGIKLVSQNSSHAPFSFFSLIFFYIINYKFFANYQYDWNKLVGISEYLNPRKSSVRLVWRYNLETKLIEIGYYIEKNYKIESEILYSVEPNKEIEVGITFNYTSTIVRADKNFRIVDFILNKELTFRNNPYFGGNKKSPHKIKLKIK
jgi:hypothetical protein